MKSAEPIQLARFSAGSWLREEDEVAAEEPLEIRVEGRPVAVVMRTPGADRELTAGFLLSEGLIRSAKDLFDITTCVAGNGGAKGNAVDAGLANPAAFDPAKFLRSTIASSSCGLCGRASIESMLRKRKPLAAEWSVQPPLLLSLPRKLSREQETFRKTGGLHACALFDRDGALLAVREDVGRHNALDKLTGWALLEKRLPLSECVVLLSGRVSFEMMQKAYSAGLPLIAAISAPTSLAVEFARESGQTLVGFLRGRSFNVYAGEERIAADLTPSPATDA